MSIIASVAAGHEEYLSIIRDIENQEKFDKYWKSKNKWDPMGVIESFMNPSSELAVDIEDYVWVMAKIGLIRFTQSDTERVVKTVRKTETVLLVMKKSRRAKGREIVQRKKSFFERTKFRWMTYPWKN